MIANSELDRPLHLLWGQMPDYLENIDEYREWWNQYGNCWIEKFREITIEHRNIGHDWQFSESQKELLQKYYDANKLLVDCLKSECYANRQLLQHIEDTLLLPFEN